METPATQPEEDRIDKNSTETPSAPEPMPNPADIKPYHRTKRALHIAGIPISLAYRIAWCALALSFVVWMDQYIDSRWLALLLFSGTMFLLKVVVDLPLDFYSDYIVEKRYKLSNQTPASWLWFQAKAWLLGAVIGGVALAGLYAALWYGGSVWYLWVWIGVMLLSIGLAKVFPLLILPLFYPSKPLDRPALAERLKTLAGSGGMTITGIFNLELSKETKKANAMLAGLGSSRRVYLSDTLLEVFEDDQIAVVFAHELGHHIRRHLLKGIALSAVVVSLLVALVYWRLNPYASDAPAGWTAAIAALAEVLLILAVCPLLISPLTNAITRHFERQSDSDALRLTNDPEAFRSAFELLSRMNLIDPDPPRWEEILFDDHPAMSKRIAMAETYVKTPTPPE